ncbi:hypothetical protein LEP1GSC165_2772 [Leptospira santarosai str. CBC523]|uniref:hypothetical protein n=1 Tax=Leptospira santarosai TaxID=28183 RepID=UPI0002BF3CF1|nr:hypothetical protein [Leptospira santarosai]EMO14950.1 hypothetical protein LEP1GSC165_2772 [Leptospira santarosai str. CBC523]EPG81588.1 hypothetical protein LEP1GSC048_1735 [Leptospira santarosai serovar Shermani str. 1342KT]
MESCIPVRTWANGNGDYTIKGGHGPIRKQFKDAIFNEISGFKLEPSVCSIG